MEPLAIVVAQIFTAMILVVMRESGAPAGRARIGRAALALEMIFVPPLLALTDTPFPTGIGIAAGIPVLLVMFAGFCILRHSARTGGE
jgi:hypothetical protein